MIRVGFLPQRAASGSLSLGTDAIWSCRDLLRESGVDLVMDCVDNVDAAWVNWQHLKRDDSILQSGLPVIVDEDRDSCQVAPELRQATLDRKSICGIIKRFVCRDRSTYSRPQWAIGYHHDGFQKVCPEAYPAAPKSAGPDFDTSLLHLGVSYGAFRRLVPLKGDLTERDRPTDVHFRGWVQYGKDDRIYKPATAHRTACVKALLSLRGATVLVSDSREVPLPQYWDELRASKICVSPWGWGTACHRDYEAILCGCLVVKPLSDHIMAFPDIYQPLPWYTPCKPDFSDLQIAVDIALKTWDQNAGVRSRLRRVLIEESTQEKTAAHIADVIHKCLERSNRGMTCETKS